MWHSSVQKVTVAVCVERMFYAGSGGKNKFYPNISSLPSCSPAETP